MKLQELKAKMKGFPYVTGAFFSNLGPSHKTINNQLVKWVKDGQILRLRKGLYSLNDDDRKAGLSKMLVANALYYPSYVSLEYALSYWGMIPEAVFSVTSITPKKTQTFTNNFGEFIFKSVKPSAFFGFLSTKDEFDYEVLIATPEKALIDFFYLKTPAELRIDDTYFEESLRLQNVDQLDTKKMEQMVKKLGSAKLKKIIAAFSSWKEKL